MAKNICNKRVEISNTINVCSRLQTHAGEKFPKNACTRILSICPVLCTLPLLGAINYIPRDLPPCSIKAFGKASEKNLFLGPGPKLWVGGGQES